VDIDFASKTATCRVDAGKFNAKAAVEALAKADFQNSSVK
jgi:hypothetical protein